MCGVEIQTNGPGTPQVWNTASNLVVPSNDTVRFYADLVSEVAGKEAAGFSTQITDYWSLALSDHREERFWWVSGMKDNSQNPIAHSLPFPVPHKQLSQPHHHRHSFLPRHPECKSPIPYHARGRARTWRARHCRQLHHLGVLSRRVWDMVLGQ